MNNQIYQEDIEAFLKYTIRNCIKNIIKINKSRVTADGRINYLVKKGLSMTNRVNFPEAAKQQLECEVAYQFA